MCKRLGKHSSMGLPFPIATMYNKQMRCARHCSPGTVSSLMFADIETRVWCTDLFVLVLPPTALSVVSPTCLYRYCHPLHLVWCHRSICSIYTLSGRIGKVVASHAAVAHSIPGEVTLIYTMHEALRGYCP